MAGAAFNILLKVGGILWSLRYQRCQFSTAVQQLQSASVEFVRRGLAQRSLETVLHFLHIGAHHLGAAQTGEADIRAVHFERPHQLVASAETFKTAALSIAFDPWRLLAFGHGDILTRKALKRPLLAGDVGYGHSRVVSFLTRVRAQHGK